MDKKNFSILLICTISAAFLGAFLSSLIIFGRIHHHCDHHHFIGESLNQPISQDFEEAFKDEEDTFQDQKKFFDNFNKDVEKALTKAHFVYINNAGLKTQETKDLYKITLDLKPFNNDPKNVHIKVSDNKVFISAEYKSKDKEDFSSAQFNQTLILPSKISSDKIKQQQNGKLLIITIPKVIEK